MTPHDPPMPDRYPPPDASSDRRFSDSDDSNLRRNPLIQDMRRAVAARVRKMKEKENA